MKANNPRTWRFGLPSPRIAPVGIAAVIACTVLYPNAALSSSGDEWAKLAALMTRAEARCIAEYRKENPAAKDVKHVQPSQYSASFILVTLDEAVTANGQNVRKQSSCMVGRRAGKAELAGPLP
jgi:hypothetical protein